MKLSSFIIISLLPLLLAADRTPAPLPPDKATKAMVVPDGFVATLVACEPDVVQPVSYCFDDRGRLFVAEALNYGEWKATGKDRIIILEDTDGDGRFEKRTLFYEGFNYITGIEVGWGGVWVMSPPNLSFIPIKEGDVCGEPTVLFDGFGHKESRHNLANGFTWGPDGWLYAGHGRTSPSDVGRPGTPADKRIHCDGGVYRIHPHRAITERSMSGVFENFADGTTNPWGVSFDDYGQCFVSNCVNPHLFHMIQGGHYEPWRNRSSSLYAYERLPTCADHLHFPSGKPNAIRGETEETLAMGGGHAHCGTLVYLGDNFPAKYRNTVFMCNVHGRRINNDILKRKGSGYTASHGPDFMLAGDPWFMGVTLRTGPNGSIFVSDWSDTGECHTYKPETRTGRIYQISYGPPKPTKVDLAAKTDEELVKLQLHANDWYVEHARRLLQERAATPALKEKAVHSALREMLANQLDSTRRLRALWALRVTSGLNTERLIALLGDGNEHIRAWAIQLLCENQNLPPKVLELLVELAKSDPSPVVRLYLACALQRSPIDRHWRIAEQLVTRGEDADDANLPLMIWYGIEPNVAASGHWAMKTAVRSRLPLLRQFIARRFVEAEIAKGEKAALDALVEALGDSADAVQLDLLKGAREGLRGRRDMKMPANWSTVYAKLKESKDSAIREHAMILAVIFGDPTALADLRKAAVTVNLPANERIAALEALLDKRPADLVSVLHDLVRDKAVRKTALRGLAIMPHQDTPAKILERYADFTLEEKQEAVATLASRKDFAGALLDAVEKSTVARTDVSAFVARQLYALNDPQLTDRLRKTWGDVRDAQPMKQEQIAKYKKLLTPNFLKNADLANGRLLFTKSCQQCHKLYGEGGTIGPDLTGANRSNLDYVLANIIDPSAEIGRDYRMSAITTKAERLITGIVVERTPTRIAIQTATEKVVMSPNDVETIKESPSSMMPENQFDLLTKEQIRDLIGYLGAKSQVPLPK